jgi:hypothetical protein
MLTQDLRRIGFFCAALVTLLDPASAAQDGCEKFAWSLAREREWFAASDKAIVSAGESLAAIPNGAFSIRLLPASEASFTLPPERKPRSERWFGGIIRMPALNQGGIYQVTLSDEAWIDVVQDGRYARSVGNTGRSDCPGLRKSVRFELGPASFNVQLSAATTDAIIIAITPAE